MPEETRDTPRRYKYKLAQIVPVMKQIPSGADIEQMINKATATGGRFVGQLIYAGQNFLVFEKETQPEVRYEDFPNVSDN